MQLYNTTPYATTYSNKIYTLYELSITITLKTLKNDNSTQQDVIGTYNSMESQHTECQTNAHCMYPHVTVY